MKNRGDSTTHDDGRHLGVLAKFWEPGGVKTRLATAVGAPHASSVYRAMLEFLLLRFAQLGDHRELCFAPAERRDDFATLAGPHWELVPQEGKSLGDRMGHFFRRALREHRQVILIGSDSPTLPVEYVERAFSELESAPLVLGPSEDGGYYLVGASRRVPPIFDRIEWSTATVWQQTMDRLRKEKWPFSELPSWFDVDQLNDLLRLREELQRFADEPAARLSAVIERALPGGSGSRR